MKTFRLDMNKNLDSKLKELAKDNGTDRAAVICKAITLYSIAREQEDLGYDLVLKKDGIKRHIELD